MKTDDLIANKARIEEELSSLTYISLYDEDGDYIDDAVQEKLEQNEYRDELVNIL